MIRMATIEDIPSLVEMNHRFLKETAYADFIVLDDDTVGAWYAGLIVGQDSFILLSEDENIMGALGGTIVPHFMDGKKSAFELFWWVEPEHRGIGGELFKEYESIIKTRGAVRSFFVAPEGPGSTISSFYERRGYSKFETTFVKEL